MSEQKNHHGRREASSRKGASLSEYWMQYKSWLAGMTRGQRVRYRCLQVAVVLSILVIVGFLFLRAWIKVPDLPNVTPGHGGGADVSANQGFEGAEAPDVALSGRREGVYTFLVAGKDVASGATDTILLLSYDTKAKTIYGLNLPRDTMINTSASSKRINTVYARNRGSKDLSEAQRVEQGMAALKAEVAKATGITPDFYVLVEWDAVGELVEALGGVEFEVPFDMDYDDPYQNLYIHQKAGLRVLNGDDAMQVIRWRKNNTGPSGGDVARLSIQQDFLKAVAKKCLQPSTFLKIPELARIFTENVTTDLTVGNILALAQKAYGMNPDEGVTFVTAPLASSFLYNRAALVTLDPDGILEVVNNGMNPYLRDIQASDLQLVYRKSNGSFGVTNAALADPKMGQVPVSKPEPEPEPDVPEPPEGETTAPNGDSSQQGGDSSGGDPAQPPDDGSQGGLVPPDGSQQPPQEGGGSQSGDGDPSQGGDASQSGQGGNPIGSIDPDQVLPDPNASVSQDIGGGTAEQGNTVTVLPSRPEPVDPAA